MSYDPEVLLRAANAATDPAERMALFTAAKAAMAAGGGTSTGISPANQYSGNSALKNLSAEERMSLGDDSDFAWAGNPYRVKTYTPEQRGLEGEWRKERARYEMGGDLWKGDEDFWKSSAVMMATPVIGAGGGLGISGIGSIGNAAVQGGITGGFLGGTWKDALTGAAAGAATSYAGDLAKEYLPSLSLNPTPSGGFNANDLAFSDGASLGTANPNMDIGRGLLDQNDWDVGTRSVTDRITNPTISIPTPAGEEYISAREIASQEAAKDPVWDEVLKPPTGFTPQTPPDAGLDKLPTPGSLHPDAVAEATTALNAVPAAPGTSWIDKAKDKAVEIATDPLKALQAATVISAIGAGVTADTGTKQSGPINIPAIVPDNPNGTANWGTSTGLLNYQPTQSLESDRAAYERRLRQFGLLGG